MLETKLWMRIIERMTGWKVYYLTTSEVRFKALSAPVSEAPGSEGK